MKTEVCLYSLHVMQELTLWLVGSIGENADPPADIQPDDSLDITLPTPLLIPNEIEREATNGTESPEPHPPSLLEYPSSSLRSYDWEATADTGGSISDHIFFTSAVEELLPSASIPLHDHDPHDRGRLDSGGIPRLRPVMPAAPPTPAFITPDAHIIIPQMPYVYDSRRQGWQHSEPIIFSTNGFPGLNMGDALRKRFTGLDGQDDLVLQGAGACISCWLEVRWS